MRKPHALKKTRSTNRPTNLLFFDTETKEVPLENGDRRLVLKLGVSAHVRSMRGERMKVQKEIVFRDSETHWKFIDRCTRSKSTNYLIAHNITFDLAVTNGFKNLHALGWTLESFYSKGITSIYRWIKDDKKLLGIDNTNLFPGKLESWGEIMGYPKLAVDFDTVSDEELIEYCKRDVEIMRQSWLTWLEFLDRNGCGAFKMTVGSTAFNTWRHRFMEDRVHIHNNLLAIDLERESYRGGRTEVLFQGSKKDQPFYYVDINNMYGFILSRYQFPCGIYDAKETDSVSQLLTKLHKYSVIAKVDIEPSEPWFPFRKDHHTIYPIGNFTTTLTTPELMLCFQRGWIRGVHAMAWYRQGYLFSSYIQHFSRLRNQYERDNNAGFSKICKLLINSLYGKFGQQGFVQTQIGETDIENIWSMPVYNIDTHEFTRHIALAGGVYEEKREGEAFHSFPGIAAHVTAYARLYLYRLVQKIPEEHVFYMDTDSMIVDQVGFDAIKHLIFPGKIGFLKIEHESNDLTVHAPKDYEMGDRMRIKGIRANAVQIKKNTFLQDQWFGLSGLIRRGDLDGAIIRPIVKHQRRVIYSGRVLPSGWVQPFDLRELDVYQAEFPSSIPSLN